jgi:hypothetical protein
MTTDRWTPETLELVASRGAGSHAAHDILEALADAGLLVVAPAAETRYEWATRHLNLDSGKTVVTPCTDEGTARRYFDYLDEVWGHHAVLLRRNISVGPWVEVPDAS